MAYMHKETFDIVVENSVKRPYDYFYVDELIALPIQVLNRKGYLTEFCCAGHSFDYLGENGDYDESLKEKMLAGEIVLPEIPKIFKSFNGYISFKESIISLPTLPPGFYIDDFAKEQWNKLAIRKDYENKDGYVFIRSVLETMEQLYEWALNLPDCKKS